MKIFNIYNLSKENIKDICSRKVADDLAVRNSTESIIDAVKARGDDALFSFAEQFDKVKLSTLTIEAEELAALAKTCPEAAQKAIDLAYDNIYRFHAAQVHCEAPLHTQEGVKCWRESRAIEKVGLYIPGGSAVLPSTLLMLGIPAKIAGCKEIVVCSPPQADGKVNCYVAYVAVKLGIARIYLVGGAQAIAAMAFGTATIPQVYKILGPGNRYVTEAKKLVQNQVTIDMPAGPSEVLVIADEQANPAYIAADLLAQAEHGADSQAVLVTTSSKIVEESINEIEKQLNDLPRKEIAQKAIANSFAVITNSLEQALQFSNEYAPEHLIIACEDYEQLIPMIQNAGSVFLGKHSPESVGDYASGTNHTLPTSAFAKAYSGVSTDTFVKKITFQELSAKGLANIGPAVEILAEAEGLQAHKNAVSIRLKDI